ncbi:tRNA (N6-threonylcarbamoyladenosine(37)-N6)-methyltransferase TrmO [archaeon]|nr:tRNA (N6-threonylcarbamoyladenosine(37)-N6)-methyltransferase TrmO [archaeon]
MTKEKIKVDLEPIGEIHSSYKTREDAPSQGNQEKAEIIIYEKYVEGLKDLETFTHLHILYWLHQSKGYTLLVNTPWDTEPHGLFATRSPNRPNPIAYSTVKILEKREHTLTVQGLDAINGTPVLDIKPYSPLIDSQSSATNGWLQGKYQGGTK